MITTSSTYKTIISDPAHFTETRLDINSVSYYADTLDSLSINRSLFDGEGASVGGTVSAEIDIEIKVPSTSIPRMALLEPYVRVVSQDGLSTSEWIPQGKFFIDTRVTDPETGLLTIHGFDAMMKTEQLYLTGSNWSSSTTYKTPSTIVGEIATRISVSEDSRNSYHSYHITKPSDDLTMRDMLSQIAAAEGGNFYITLEGKLRLVALGDIPAETSLLVDDYGNPILFGTVRIIV